MVQPFTYLHAPTHIYKTIRIHTLLFFLQNWIMGIFKLIVPLVLIICLHALFEGIQYVRHSLHYYQTISLISTRVYADTSAVLENEVMVSNFSNLDRFTFSTQSTAVTCIYMTKCKPYHQSISRRGLVESERTIIFHQLIASGSSIKIEIKTVSPGVYNDCSTKLWVLDKERYEYTFVKTRRNRQPYRKLCISKPITNFLFKPQKTSYFSFVIMTSEKIRFLVTGNILWYRVLAKCLISNEKNCYVHQAYFADEATVCITASSKDLDSSYSDIDHSTEKEVFSTWKKFLLLILLCSLLVFVRLLLINFLN